MRYGKPGIVVAIVATTTIMLWLATLLLAVINIGREGGEAQNTTMARHLNPSELKPVKPPSKLLENLIASSLKALARGDVETASKLVEILNETILPREWRSVVKDFVADLAKLVQLVGNTTALEKRIRVKTALNDIVGVLEACEEARQLLARFNITYSMLLDRIDRLARLGVNTALLKKELGETVSLAQQVEQHIRRALLEARLAQHRLHSTRLWINVTPTKVFYGESMVVEGCLASGKNPLPGRPIVLHYDNRTMELYTGVDGCFKTTVKAVAEGDHVTIYAEYVPRGRDRLLYTYARSPIVHVRVLRVKPILLAYAYNDVVYPGDNITVHIFSSIEGVEVVVKAFGVVERVWLEGHSVNHTLRVPLNISTGVYNVTVVVPRQNGVEEASAIDWIVVVREPLNAMVHVPSVALAGLDLPITLHANASARVLIATPWHAYAATISSNKTNTVRIHIPITYPNIFASVKIVLEPLDPRYEEYRVECSVVVLNPLALATLSTIPSIVLTSLLRQRRVERVEELASPAKTSSRRRQVGREATVYAGLLKRVEEVVGVRLSPSETLREYLARVRGLLDSSSYRVLERIVYVYEAVLYGGRRELMRELVARIEELERVKSWSRRNKRS